MPGGDDPDNRRDFPGGFPNDATNAFTAAGRTPEQQEVFTYVQSLLALRKAHPALREGKQWHIAWDDSYYAFVRALPEEKLLVVYNNSSASRDLAIAISDTLLEGIQGLDVLFGTSTATVNKGEVHVSLQANTLEVFRAR
jgi:glycosidase